MESGIPLLGAKFPEMTVTTTQGQMHLPGDLAGKWFVLFSHPADFTPVCTTEFVAFQKRYKEFKALNCELIGLSIDQVFSHIKWIEWIGEKLGEQIEFPVIADDMGHVAATLGMVHPGKGTNTVRAVFIVDDKGVLRIMFYYPQELGRNIDEIVRAVKGMQTSDAYGVAIPAGWPNNELIGGKVIIPPAKDVKTARERAGKNDSYDWWFCYRNL
jgi:peroxiredoxin (alkyl hydroperoxide reductase subunit C)